MASRAERPVPRTLVWATHLDVLPPSSVVERRDGYLAVRSPSNPSFWFGNLLLFDDPPGTGAAAEWERIFELEFARDPGVRHRTFGWDRGDGDPGAAEEEFPQRGYRIDEMIGLVAAPADIRPHERANREVTVEPLDPAPGAEEARWEAVIELQTANRDEQHREDAYRTFAQARQRDLREHFRRGRGAWYAAIARDGEVVASCGVVVTGPRGRFQAVDTAPAHRRQGIASRLVVEAGHHAAVTYGAEQLVIAADADYHALGLYESLGFARHEHIVELCRAPEPG